MNHIHILYYLFKFKIITNNLNILILIIIICLNSFIEYNTLIYIIISHPVIIIRKLLRLL